MEDIMDLINEIRRFNYYASMNEARLLNKENHYGRLSHNSILYLTIINNTPDCTVSKLAELMDVTRSAATIKVNELIKQGALEKIQCKQDRRIFYIRLSSTMKVFFNDVFVDIYNQIGEKLQEKYTQEQLDLFSDIMHTITSYDWGQTANE